MGNGFDNRNQVPFGDVREDIDYATLSCAKHLDTGSVGRTIAKACVLLATASDTELVLVMHISILRKERKDSLSFGFIAMRGIIGVFVRCGDFR